MAKYCSQYCRFNKSLKAKSSTTQRKWLQTTMVNRKNKYAAIQFTSVDSESLLFLLFPRIKVSGLDQTAGTGQSTSSLLKYIRKHFFYEISVFWSARRWVTEAIPLQGAAEHKQQNGHDLQNCGREKQSPEDRDALVVFACMLFWGDTSSAVQWI